MHNDKLGGQHRGWGGDKLEQRVVISKDENIGNHGYIGTSILRIYRIYRRYIGIYRRYISGYFGKKYWCLKLLKTHENVKKTS